MRLRSPEILTPPVRTLLETSPVPFRGLGPSPTTNDEAPRFLGKGIGYDGTGAEMKVLVVGYSRSGTTLSVAERIAELLGADLELIRERTSRRGILGLLRSGYEALTRKTPPIEEPEHDPSAYDLVVVGTPIWAGRMSSPVRAYLTRMRGSLKRVAFFCTSGGGGHKKALSEMARVAGAKPIATLELTSDQIKRNEYSNALRDFVTALKRAKEDIVG